MPFSTKIIRLINRVDEPLREILVSILEEIEQQREETVTKREFNELKLIVKELSNNLKELTLKVNFLAEAQKKTEQRLNELAEAQEKTEKELKKLVTEHRKTREQLGGLSHTVGYILEDRAYKGLPELLKRDFNIELISTLKRDYIEISPDNYFEINIIGKGKINNKIYYIIGEAKTQLKKKDVNNFLSKIKKIENIFPERIYLFVTYQTSPQVLSYAREKGIKVYFSYEMPLA